jgi:hypothetical protein
MNAGAQSAHAFIENNGRGKPNFSSFGQITGKPELTPETASNQSGNVPVLM